MASLLRDALSFLTDRDTHPIVRREAAGWSTVGFWRGLRQGCLPIALAIVLLPAALCGLMSVVVAADSFVDTETIIAALFLPLMGALIGGEIVRWVAGLLATVVASTTVSSEIEAQTYGLLRLTPLSAREIVLAKFGVAVRQLRAPMAVVIVVRLVGMVGLAAVLGALIVAGIAAVPAMSSTPPLPLRASPMFSADVVSFALGLLATGPAVIAAILSWLAYYLVSPVLGLVLFASTGMLASTWARTRAGGVAVAAGMRVVLWMLSYVFSQVISTAISLLSMPLMMLTSTPALWEDWLAGLPPIAIGFGGAALAGIWVLGMLAIQVGVILILLALAIQRAGRLPYPR